MSHKIPFQERFDHAKVVLTQAAARTGQRCDSDAVLAFTRQLEQIETDLHKVEYAKGHAVEIIPVKTDVDRGAKSLTARAYDRVGRARRISTMADQWPKVDVSGKEITSYFANYGIAQQIDLQEQWSADFANIPLKQLLDDAAREAVDQEVDEVAWFGDSDINVTGFANNPLVPLVPEITGAWPTATPSEILADMQKVVNAVKNGSNGVERADSLALPDDLFSLVSSTFIGASAPGETVLSMFKKANPNIAVFESFKLRTADAPRTGSRMVAFSANPRKVALLAPMLFFILPVIDLGGNLEIRSLCRLGGVRFLYPLSAAYMDGLGTVA